MPAIVMNEYFFRQLKQAHRDRAAILREDEDPLLVSHLFFTRAQLQLQ